MPEVSVIIPTHNRAGFVGRAINSVLAQTFDDIEVIVVDDASTDNTQHVLKRFIDKRIKIICHEKNCGGSAARNTGIKHAKGYYIGLLDDDDEWLPDKLEKQLTAFKSAPTNVGIYYSSCYFLAELTNKVLSQTEPTLRGSLHKILLRTNVFPPVTTLVKKNCFIKAGLFDETLPSCQDWDMWIRISKYFDIDFIPDALAKVHIHGDQISVNLTAKIIGREKLLDKYDKELAINPSILAFHLKRLGILYCLSENRTKALKYFLKSVNLLPLQKEPYFHILFSLLAPKWHKNFLEKHRTSKLDEVTLYY